MRSLFRFFAERHLLAYLITVMIIILGLNTLLGIKRSIWPEADFGIMNVITRYPGASPEDVELNVTNKIERELKTIVGLDRMTSISMENVSVIEVNIDPDADDQEKIKTDVREAVGRVTDLPPEVTESPRVTELKSSQVDVIEVGLTGELPHRELRELARLFEKKLLDVPGVARLDRFGYRAREIRVEVSPKAMSQYQLPLREIIAAIQERNIRATTGSFESYTTEQDLVTLAQFRHPIEVGDVIVRSTFEGALIKVKDLAVIRDDFEDERVLSRMNGKPAISFLVYPSEYADVIRTCDAIKALIHRERTNLPDDVELQYVNDESRYVRDSFNVVLSNGLIGLALILVILPVFLNFRTAFWVAMGIPVALLGTIFLLPLFGIQLDTIGLTGMILVIGIIVDDAIIVAENIIRRREEGDKPLDAAVEGIREVFRPVLTTVLTTIIVFAPTFFIPGVLGKMIVPVPLAITLALFISMGEVTVALPAHLLPGLRTGALKFSGRKWFRRLSDNYRGVVLHILRFRYILILLFIILLAGSFWYAARYMKFILFPTGTSEHVFIGYELTAGTPLHVTSDRMKEVEALLLTLPEEELASFTTRIGFNPFINAENENYASISLNLTPYTARSRTTDEIVEDLREKTDQLQGQGRITYTIVGTSPPVGMPISLRVAGSDDFLRTLLADSVEAFLGRIAGVKDITRDDKGGKNQTEIKINYDRLSQLGLTVADVARNVRIAYDGEVVTSIRYGDEDVAFKVMIQEQARRQLSDLRELLIPNREGRLIPLREMARLATGPGPSDFRHFDGERSITIEADLDRDITTPLEVTDMVFEHFNVERDWPGMRLALGGELFATEESMAGLSRSFIIAIVGIYFLLVLLFNSLTQPILVMLAIPFGIMGVIIAFALHGEPFSFMSIMDIIGLCGVVINDSLVLVNHINDLRRLQPGGTIPALVAEGTAHRLRAIVLTSLTTVVALLPLAYGLGGNAPFMAPIALALGWGLVFATPITLVLVPCLYMIGLDINRIFRGRKPK